MKNKLILGLAAVFCLTSVFLLLAAAPVVYAELPDPTSKPVFTSVEAAVQLVEPAVYGPPTERLSYYPIEPCRVVDTRAAIAGRMQANETRSFMVVGTIGFAAQGGKGDGCGIPEGMASAVVMNFTAVGPQGTGYLRAAADPGPLPTATLLNYAQASNLNVANGIAVPICTGDSCASDVIVRTFDAATHLVIDVVGYYAPPPLPFTNVKSSWYTTLLPASGACTAYTGATVTVNAPVAGTVTVRANAWMYLGHTTGTTTAVVVGIGETPTDCNSDYGYQTYHQIPPEWPTGVAYQTIPTMRQVTVGAGAHTFYLTGSHWSGGVIYFWYAGMEASFEPR